eukprot:CAMPEP_0196821756 /NCGR_PEP_ID=MMETSP1362-20130617/80788_1 /TAXON_ID=163516 /ORGANISM="Leptocylindrus danicus, Strain CCMP1856" /LENGTH=436 /DNA_ID=CAMNT_0042201087 /DNA_START=59 /DNA_END=1369 /DNA_ORIENTATION=-
MTSTSTLMESSDASEELPTTASAPHQQLSSPPDEELEGDTEGEEDAEDAEDVKDGDENKPSSTGPPVKLTIKTGLNSQLLDQSLELMVSRHRNVASLKLSCFRQMRGRPPVLLQTIRYGMSELDDEMTIDELIDDDDEDDEDENEEEDAEPALTLILDIAPPVDPKFATELKDMIRGKTTEEIIDAYAGNAASLMSVSRSLTAATEESLQSDSVFDSETIEAEDGEIEEKVTPNTSSSSVPENLWMRKQALLVKNQLLSTMSEEALKLLDKTDEEEEVVGDALLASSIRRKRRGGGAKMNVKRALQRNLNIDWGMTIRNFMLFLFFGYFGARDALSRSLMYLGAPMCFIIQARPVKILIKQLFYGIGKPPGILLSLLPAPQQKIMDLDFKAAMEDLYGAPKKKTLGGLDDLDENPGENEDEEYDDEYDSEEDYDED